MSTYTMLLAPSSDPGSVEPSPSVDEADLTTASETASARPTPLDGHLVDQLLLEAFTRARRRFRGAIVAISARTMISNAAASELLQPEDRRMLWQQAHAGGPHGTEPDAPLVLASGMLVYSSCHPVESDGCLLGVVLHLQVAADARVTLAGAPLAGFLEGGGVRHTIPPTTGAGLPAWSDLTDSERSVAELVGRGLSNKQAARRLFVSRHTVDYHLRRIYRKLGIGSRVELARMLGERYESLVGIPEERIA